MPTKLIAYCLTPILATAGVLVVVFWTTATTEQVRGNIRVEVVKALLQLSVVIIIGGGVAALYKLIEVSRAIQQEALERTRQENRIRAEIRTEFLNRLGSLYRAVKGARRTLRAGGLTTRFGNAPSTINDGHAKIYCEQMARINEAQLELEGLKIEAESFPAFVPLKNVDGNLRKMEDYLRQILGEYEKARPQLDSGHTVKFAELERLDEFTGSTGREFAFSRYKTKTDYRLISHFSIPSERVVEEISEHLT